MTARMSLVVGEARGHRPRLQSGGNCKCRSIRRLWKLLCVSSNHSFRVGFRRRCGSFALERVHDGSCGNQCADAEYVYLGHPGLQRRIALQILWRFGRFEADRDGDCDRGDDVHDHSIAVRPSIGSSHEPGGHLSVSLVGPRTPLGRCVVHRVSLHRCNCRCACGAPGPGIAVVRSVGSVHGNRTW